MRIVNTLVLVTILVAFVASCAGVVYAPGPPPAKKVEVKPASPGPKAVWVEGHWKWAGNKYMWVPGHWEKMPKGKWVAGHHVKKGKKGYVWVPGHWKR
jgi:hypothetical protein